MNKVGILTFVDTINFGASLQAYALQETIESWGIRAEVIDYKNTGVEAQESNKGKFGLRKIAKKLLLGSSLKKKKTAFKKFEDAHIHKGLELSNSTVKAVNEEYDYIVCGSDQVWNMRITANDMKYFLDFIDDDRKKITYAPSFGNDVFPKEYYAEVAKYLSRIPQLSVRERSGAEFIYNQFGLDAKVVIDPTLLLSKEEWISKIKFKPDYEHYILVYFPHDKKKVFEFVDILKEQTKYPVIYLSISPKKQKGVKTIYDASPDEFLGWALNAEYIVTGSFHGTAFSVNFEKQFYYESYEKGSRINNLVELLGIDDRSIEIKPNLSKKIDYTNVRSRLDKERSNSKEWLKSALLFGKK